MLTSTEFWDLKHQIDDEVKRLGWSTEECIVYIKKHYSKRSRLVMTDEQLFHLRDTLRSLTPEILTQNLLSTRRESRRRKRF